MERSTRIDGSAPTPDEVRAAWAALDAIYPWNPADNFYATEGAGIAKGVNLLFEVQRWLEGEVEVAAVYSKGDGTELARRAVTSRLPN